jgi:hypothetical protein
MGEEVATVTEEEAPAVRAADVEGTVVDEAKEGGGRIVLIPKACAV